jgi:bacteriorhodopsin
MEFFMKKLKLFALVAAAVMGLSGIANAETSFLPYDDFVGISFWLVSMGCLAATVFFFLERGSVPASWRASMTVAGLVTGIAFINYMYIREIWISMDELPIAYRYIDWLITMPLLMLQFYFVLSAVRKVYSGTFWKLLFGSLAMFIGGFLGEAGHVPLIVGFVILMAAWIFILYEVFSGDAGKLAAKSGNKALVTAFGAMRMIVTIGWSVYPLGYVFGTLIGDIDANSLNVIYNAVDFLNKIAFGLIIWAAAMQQSGRAK